MARILAMDVGLAEGNSGGPCPAQPMCGTPVWDPDQRTACRSSFDGRKRGIRPPATVTVRPVRGLRTVRALRRVAENVPKPTRVTVSPRLSAVRIPASIERTARSVAVLDQPVVVAMRLTRAARVTYMPRAPRASSITSSVTCA